MKIALRIVVIALVVAAAVWLWGVFFPSADKVIRKRLAETARAASFDSSQSALSKMASAQRLQYFFATNVEINLDLPGHQARQMAGRDEIVQAALAARGSIESVKITFPDVMLTIAPDKQSATADVTAEVKISGDADLNPQEMKFELRKIDGHWLITRVETVQSLQKPEAAH
ncbi:MAG TPA: hypothetical protein VGO67_12870 [Verrucomicrobiae bacterium]